MYIHILWRSGAANSVPARENPQFRRTWTAPSSLFSILLEILWFVHLSTQDWLAARWIVELKCHLRPHQQLMPPLVSVNRKSRLIQCAELLWHVNNIPTMQFLTGISRTTQSKLYMLSLTECVWESQNNALWDTHLHALLCIDSKQSDQRRTERMI